MGEYDGGDRGNKELGSMNPDREEEEVDTSHFREGICEIYVLGRKEKGAESY